MKKLFLLMLLLALLAGTKGQSESGDETVVRSIADRILAETHYGFTAQSGKLIYNTASEVPEDTLVKFRSEFLSWHYANGVINMAMADLGDFLQDDRYTQHCIQQVYFGFDNYKVFEARYKPGMPRWGYPYRELFSIRELDDCGAMGASAIEAYKRKPSQELRDYFDRIADHILNKQDRLEDKTLVRKGPHEMTLWADDLFMSVPFLARMGELTGDPKYFDDAVLSDLGVGKEQYAKYDVNKLARTIFSANISAVKP